MIRKTIIAASAGLAVVVAGCDDERERTIEDDTIELSEQRSGGPYDEVQQPLGEEGETETPTASDEEIAMGQGAPAYGEETMEGMPETELEETELLPLRSDHELAATMQRVRRELRNDGKQVVGVVRLNLQPATSARAGQQTTTEEGAAKPEDEMAMPMQHRQAPARAELILFADPNAMTSLGGDPATLLDQPTAVLVYEDATGGVFVAFDDPMLQQVMMAAVTGAQGERGMQGPHGMQGQQGMPGAETENDTHDQP